MSPANGQISDSQENAPAWTEPPLELEMRKWEIEVRLADYQAHRSRMTLNERLQEIRPPSAGGTVPEPVLPCRQCATVSLTVAARLPNGATVGCSRGFPPKGRAS